MAFKKSTLEGYIQEALYEMGVTDISFTVEKPQETAHGDYATNVALIASKKLGSSPKEVAEKIKGNMEGK